MLWMASCFHVGSGGMNLTSSCCRTPRLNVHSAWSADNVVPSASITTTPLFDVKIADTVAFKRTCLPTRNSSASA